MTPPGAGRRKKFSSVVSSSSPALRFPPQKLFPEVFMQAANQLSLPTASIALAVAFAIQQVVETVDVLVTAVLGNDTDLKAAGPKKALLKLLALALGIFGATIIGVDLLSGTTGIEARWHPWITAIALAGGTEGVNSVLKYLGYAKENKKGQAAATLEQANQESLRAISRK
jgi:hypothetical protein